LQRYDWLILTSVNGAEVFFERLERIASANLSGLRVAAIGPATREEIERHGMQVQVVPPEYVAESVVRELRAKVKGKQVLLVRASVARDVIPRELRKAGARVDVVEAYRTELPRRSAARLRKLLGNPMRRPHVITFTSSSTVKNFVKMAGKAALDDVLLASIGPVTSATLRGCGLRANVEAKDYTMPGLVAAIKKAFTTKGTKAMRR
jgi:uroporphyrinogen-III synthase